VLLALKRPFRDDTTRLKFTPEDFMARLAALVPRPRANLIRYHGVLAPAHPWRRWVTGMGQESEGPGSDSGTGTGPAARRGLHRHGDGGAVVNEDEPADIVHPPKAPLTWAERLRRVFGIEITVCPHCGGRLRVIADVTAPDVINRILEHVRREGLPRAPPIQGDPA
jgi:hypothetical protein